MGGGGGRGKGRQEAADIKQVQKWWAAKHDARREQGAYRHKFQALSYPQGTDVNNADFIASQLPAGAFSTRANAGSFR